MSGERLEGWAADASVIALAGCALYAATLAPTVLWGDDAELQRLAAGGGVLNPGRGHALWLLAARAFQPIPWGDPARRANLVSAVFGAATLPLVYLAARRAAGARAAGWCAAAALGVAHTFWLHAVRAEVYTLHTFLLAGVLALALRWAASPERIRPLAGAFFLAGLGLNNHLMMATALPALAWLLWAGGGPPGRARWGRALLAAASFAAGAAPYLVAALPAAAGDPLARPLESLDPLAVRPRHLALAAGYLAYQFPIGILAAVLGSARLLRERRVQAVFVILVWAAGAAFAVSFHVRDQYVFHLPAHLAAALLVGAGAAGFLARDGGARAARLVRAALAAAALVAAPVALYAAAPAIVEKTGIAVPGFSPSPGRDLRFFLWPPKNGHTAARRYAEEVFAALPEDAVLLVDWTPAQTLRYVQEVDSVRPDVTLKQLGAGWGLQVPYLIARSAGRPVFIAGTGPHYDVAEIEEAFTIAPAGPVFRLTPRR